MRDTNVGFFLATIESHADETIVTKHEAPIPILNDDGRSGGRTLCQERRNGGTVAPGALHVGHDSRIQIFEVNWDA